MNRIAQNPWLNAFLVVYYLAITIMAGLPEENPYLFPVPLPNAPKDIQDFESAQERQKSQYKNLLAQQSAYLLKAKELQAGSNHDFSAEIKELTDPKYSSLAAQYYANEAPTQSQEKTQSGLVEQYYNMHVPALQNPSNSWAYKLEDKLETFNQSITHHQALNLELSQGIFGAVVLSAVVTTGYYALKRSPVGALVVLVLLSSQGQKLYAAPTYKSIVYTFPADTYGGVDPITISGVFENTDEYPCTATSYPDITYELYDDDLLTSDDLIATYSGYLDNEPIVSEIAFSHTFQVNLANYADNGNVNLYAKVTVECYNSVYVADSRVSSGVRDVDVLPAQCSSGSCCDTQRKVYKKSDVVCDAQALEQYDCPWGTSLGADVGRKTLARYCSGTTANCNGAYASSWSAHTVADACNSKEYCIDDQSTCAACIDSDSDGVCDDNEASGCVGETATNVPSNTNCMSYSFNSNTGCHEETYKSSGYTWGEYVSCSSSSTTCRTYNDVEKYCDGSGNEVTPSCNSYTDEPSSTACGTGYSYSCNAGNDLGDDVYRASTTKYCNGYGSCSGSTSVTGSWTSFDDCTATEYCSYDGATSCSSCTDSDNDGVCDDNEPSGCVGEKASNLPSNTTCSDYTFNSVTGCHDVSYADYGTVAGTTNCDYMDTTCRDFNSVNDICDGSGSIIYGTCGTSYSNDDGTTICSTSGSYGVTYSCVGDDPGSDVFVQDNARLCGANTGLCDGDYVAYGDAVLDKDCSNTEQCSASSGTCIDSDVDGDGVRDADDLCPTEHLGNVPSSTADGCYDYTGVGIDGCHAEVFNSDSVNISVTLANVYSCDDGTSLGDDVYWYNQDQLCDGSIVDGTHRLEVECNDREVCVPGQSTCSLVAPFAEITSISNGDVFASGNTISFNLTSEDPNGDSMTYSWYVDNSLVSTSISYSSSSLSVGSHNVYVVVSDGTYNYTSETISFEISNGPSAYFYNEDDLLFSSDENALFIAGGKQADGDSVLASDIEWFVDAVSQGTGFTFSTALGIGVHTIKVVVADSDTGLEKEVSRVVNVNNYYATIEDSTLGLKTSDQNGYHSVSVPYDCEVDKVKFYVEGNMGSAKIVAAEENSELFYYSYLDTYDLVVSDGTVFDTDVKDHIGNTDASVDLWYYVQTGSFDYEKVVVYCDQATWPNINSYSGSTSVNENDVVVYNITAENYDYVEWYYDDALVQNGSNLVYTHSFDYSSAGSRSIEVRVVSSSGSESYSWSVDVIDVNQPPVKITDDNSLIYFEGDTIKLSQTNLSTRASNNVDSVFVDYDGDTLTYVISGSIIADALNNSLNTEYVIPYDMGGSGYRSYAGNIEISDGISSIFSNFDIKFGIYNKDREPTIENTNLTFIEGDYIEFGINFTDLDELDTDYLDDLEKSFNMTDASGKFNLNGSTISYNSTYLDAGSYDIELEVSDAKATVKKNITITIEPFNSAPQITDISPLETTLYLTVGQAQFFSINASDAEGDDLSYTWKLNGQEVSGVDNYLFNSTTNSELLNQIELLVSDGELFAVQKYKVWLSNLSKTHTLQLNPGWNLIGLPVDPDQSDIAGLMANCTYNNIYAFDGNQWSSMESGLTNFEIYKGYWIDRNNLSTTCEIDISGTAIVEPELNVDDEWNLISVPGLHIMPLSTYLSIENTTEVWSFDPATGWRSLETGLENFTPGKGYWLRQEVQ